MANLKISQLPISESGSSDSLMVIVNYDVESSGITNSIYFSSLTEQFSGSSGSSGSSGTSGINGTSGSSGSSGTSGINGTSGSSGSSGTSGTGFSTVQNFADKRVLTSDGTPDGAIAESGLTYDYVSQVLNVSGAVQFDTGTTATNNVGRVKWNNTEGTLDFLLKGGDVDLNIGKQNVALCYNDELNQLNKGEVVYISGDQGNIPAVKRALAVTNRYFVKVLGIVAEPISSGSEGFVITYGMNYNLNTSGFTGGNALWLSPTIPGGYTETKPQSPDHTILVGYVVDVGSTTGSIFVNVSNSWNIEELNNVKVSGETNGDLLVYNSGNTLWENSKTLTGDYNIIGDLNLQGALIHVTETPTVSLPGEITKFNCSIGKSIFIDWAAENGSIRVAGNIIAAFDCLGNISFTNQTTPVVDPGGTILSFSVNMSASPGVISFNGSSNPPDTWKFYIALKILR
jgi:hypothetical protein